MRERGFTLCIDHLEIKGFTECFQRALEREERFIVTECTDAQAADFCGVCGQRQGFRLVNIGNLKESACHIAAAQVADNGIQHGCGKRGAHQGQVFADRVENPDRFAFFCVFCKTEHIEVLRGEEGVEDRFGVALCAERLLDAQKLLLFFISAAGSDGGFFEECRNDVFVAVGTNDFFCDILNMIVDVVTPSGNHDMQIVAVDGRSKAECIEMTDDFLCGNLNTENLIHLGDGNRQRMRLGGVAGGHFNVNLGYLTAAELFHQVKRTLHTELGGVFVHALFKAGGGIGGLTERTGGLADIVACKLRRFKQDIGRSILDFRVQTAHNTCQRNRLVTVADDEVFRIQLEFLFVKRCDLLAFLCSANNDFGVFKIV